MSSDTIFILTDREDNLYIDIGKNILKLRKSKKLTQHQVALRLGVSTQQVQKYEAAKGCMYVHTLIQLANIFSVPINSLLARTDTAPFKIGKTRYIRDSVPFPRAIDE